MTEINILLPFKEKFSKNSMSSVSISVSANVEKSVYKKNIKIFGQHIEDPIYNDLFIGIKKPLIPFISKNLHLTKKMCVEINKSKFKNPIIEIHNRPYLVNYVKNKVKKSKIILFFHNNPLDMKGSKTIKERLRLINICSEICFVSEYIKTKFLTDLKLNYQNLSVIYNGINLNYREDIKKEKNIVFVGRLVKEKGAHLFLEAAKKLSKKYKCWKFTVVGSAYLGSSLETKFSRKIKFLINELGSNIIFTGYLPYKQTQNILRKSEILVVPSIWQEPFGLVIAEGMMHGCAIVTSDNGAIPEIIEDKGIILQDINVDKITSAVEFLITNNILRKKLQSRACSLFQFTSSNSSKKLDKLRQTILKKK